VAQKLMSIFEPTTEIIRKGKANKRTEFQSREQWCLTGRRVYERAAKHSDCQLR
jgi:hypothetical protein